MKKSVFITHSCGHGQWHKYDEWKYRDRSRYRSYVAWLSDQPCSSCQADQVNKAGKVLSFSELKGSPGAIAYAGQCRSSLLDALYAAVYQDYMEYLGDPEFMESKLGQSLAKSYQKYEKAVGKITSASTLIELSKQDFEAVVAFLDRDEA